MVGFLVFIYSYLYWTDADPNSAKIERSDLSGSSRTVIFAASNLVRPTTLVVDFSSDTHRVFWLDPGAGVVGSCNPDASDIQSWSNSEFSVMSSMTIFQVHHFIC